MAADRRDDTYILYINGAEATPDENGVYTIPAGSYADTVSIAGAKHYDRVACSCCGEMHDGTVWGRLLAFIRQIPAFLTQLHGKLALTHYEPSSHPSGGFDDMQRCSAKHGE